MIASALRDGIRYRTPEQALAAGLDAARHRLTIGGPVVDMEGRHGTLTAIYAEDNQVMVAVMLDDNTMVRDRAGYWARSIL